MAGGVAGGLAGGGSNHAAEIGAGAQAGKNAVENNRLTLPQMKQAVDELADCMVDYSCSTAEMTAKWTKIDIEQELEYQKGNFSAPKAYVKDVAICYPRAGGRYALGQYRRKRMDVHDRRFITPD